MREVVALGYVVVSAADLDAWSEFGQAGLGLQLSNPDADGDTLLFRMDDRRWRLAVQEGTDGGLVALGFEVAGPAELTSLCDRLEAAGLAERAEEGRRILGRGQGAGAGETTAPVTSAPRRRLALGPSEVGVGEFALAGLASVRDEWVAFAYSPLGALNVYRAGARLADGSVRSVQSTDVLLTTEEGDLRVFLPEMPR